MQSSKESRIRNLDKKYRDGWWSWITVGHKLILQRAQAYKDAGVKTALDICCGRGRLIQELKHHGINSHGTEVVPFLLDEVLQDWCIFPYNASQLCEIEDNSYDCVILCDVLEFILDEERDLYSREAKRIASKLVVVTLTPEAGQFNEAYCWWKKYWAEFIGGCGKRGIEISRNFTGALRIEVWLC